jgi:hypothetical protein
MLLRDPFLLLTTLYVLAILILGYASAQFDMAVYALSFWHYLVYALAFFWRAIGHQHFISDSVLLKSISLAAFFWALALSWPAPLPLIIMAAGFSLNIAAARALGAERTYYGFELATLPPKRVTSFPYSITRHPMLIGSMLAYGAPLLDMFFRQAWWPLALLHVLLNLLIILNESYGDKSRRLGMLWSIIGLGGGSLLLLAGFWESWPYALATIVVSVFFGVAIMRRYA